MQGDGDLGAGELLLEVEHAGDDILLQVSRVRIGVTHGFCSNILSIIYKITNLYICIYFFIK